MSIGGPREVAMTKRMRGGVRLGGVNKTYGEGAAAVHALRDVDLDIPAGAMMAILGPSGSGKTTLLNVIGGIGHFRDDRGCRAGYFRTPAARSGCLPACTCRLCVPVLQSRSHAHRIRERAGGD